MTDRTPEPGTIGMSPGQKCWQWTGEQFIRRPDLDGLTLADAMRAGGETSRASEETK